MIQISEEKFRLVVHPNLINKFSLYLTGRITKGVELFGVGPMAMRSYWSLLDNSKLVGFALSSGYRVFIIKEGKISKEEDWNLEFRKIFDT